MKRIDYIVLTLIILFELIAVIGVFLKAFGVVMFNWWYAAILLFTPPSAMLLGGLAWWLYLVITNK